MPQSLEIQNGPGYIVQDEMKNFINSLDNNYYNLPSFNWDFDAQLAVDLSYSPYPYNTSELVMVLEDVVNYLSTTGRYTDD